MIYLDGQCQKFPVGNFKWDENISQFCKDFVGNCSEKM